jgi:multidrug efflux system membrane fusion protein
VLALIVLLLVIAGGSWGWREFKAWRGAPSLQQASQAQPPVPVTVAAVKTADVPVYLYGLGTVGAYNTVTIRSRVDGEIQKIGFNEGQVVHEGDLLAQIDPRPFKATLDQMVAKKALDEASLANAKLDLNRFATLAKQDFSSRQQVDTQRSLVSQLTAQIEADDAQIESAQIQLDYSTIRAPLTGQAGFRQIDAGNIVHASDQSGIVAIAQLQPISVFFTAPEGELPRIAKALAAGPLPVTAFSSDGLTELAQGRLAILDNTIDQASGTIRLKAVFDNPDNVLWPGLSVSTRLSVDRPSSPSRSVRSQA